MSGEGETSPKTLPEILVEYRIPIVLGIVSIVCIAISLSLLIKSYSTNSIVFSEVENSNELSISITVDVAGAVNRPGVYRLAGEARIDDAIIASGGLTDAADTELISKSVNRAARLKDGVKLYIPSRGEREDDATTTSHNNSFATNTEGESLGTAIITNGDASQNSGSLIGINTATESDLDTLPGIGPVTARKIIDNRPYGKLEELIDKKAVGKSVYEKIKDKIML